MPKKYFFSPDLSECAGCDTRVAKANNVGTVTLDTPEHPQMHYVLCARCVPRLMAGETSFIRTLERTLIARAEALGAYDQGKNPATPKNWGGAK